MLSATATVLESEKYYPYGGPRTGGTTKTDRKFTGQQDEGAIWNTSSAAFTGVDASATAFGLYNHGARFYSTVLGRFTSADPVAFKLGNPQMLDRYASAIDNPLRYTDPTGLCVPGVNCPDDLPEDLDTSISSNAPYGPSSSDPLSAPASLPTTSNDTMNGPASYVPSDDQLASPSSDSVPASGPEDGLLALRVADTGGGIPPEHLPHVFASLSPGRARSAPGRGSVFTITFPVSSLEAQPRR